MKMETERFVGDFSRKCGEVFLTKNGDIHFYCTLCVNNFESFEEYAMHTISEHYASEMNEEDEYTTVETPFEMVSIEIEEQSLSSFHSNEENDIYNTQIEKTTFEKQNENNQRLNTCNICGSSFKHYTNLLGHIKRHSNHKPHECTFCAKRFYTRTELTKHTRKHTGEHPYLCSECGQKFVTATGFTAHVQRHTNERTKQCPICDMRFFSNGILKAHLATHNDHRPYQCNMCDASFKLIKTLKSHLKIHENKRNYHCELCSAKFNQKPGLYLHMKSKHAIIN